MTTTDNIFALEPRNTSAFERTALETFRFQADRCAVYREYLDRIGVVPAEVTRIEQIPFLPIELFKRREVYAGDRPPEIVFTSSNTGGTIQSATEKLLEDGEYTRLSKARSPVIGAVSGGYWLVVVAVFLYYTYGPKGNGNGQHSWFIWAIAGVLFGAIMLVLKTVKRSGKKD